MRILSAISQRGIVSFFANPAISQKKVTVWKVCIKTYYSNSVGSGAPLVLNSLDCKTTEMRLLTETWNASLKSAPRPRKIATQATDKNRIHSDASRFSCSEHV